MSKAATLEKSIFLFNPIKPLSTPEELRDFYVDRGSGVRDELIYPLRASDLDEKVPIKFLFTGHTGCGKSTEINSICQDLEDQFLIVRVRIRNRPDVSYVDVLLKAALALFGAASDQALIRRAPAQIAADVWNKAASPAGRSRGADGEAGRHDLESYPLNPPNGSWGMFKVQPTPSRKAGL
jgi:Cdc6-like AAA superfamily ATPase